MKLKPGARIAIINASESYFQGFEHDQEIFQKLDGKFDGIQIFVENKTELDALAP